MMMMVIFKLLQLRWRTFTAAGEHAHVKKQVTGAR
jgi:hypothetical protein